MDRCVVYKNFSNFILHVDLFLSLAYNYPSPFPFKLLLYYTCTNNNRQNVYKCIIRYKIMKCFFTRETKIKIIKYTILLPATLRLLTTSISAAFITIDN